jgi:hypothetical protein
MILKALDNESLTAVKFNVDARELVIGRNDRRPVPRWA